MCLVASNLLFCPMEGLDVFVSLFFWVDCEGIPDENVGNRADV